MDTITIDRIAESVEREFDRLKRARPVLHSRIERAENILVTHLSCRRANIIKPRVRGGKLVAYLVRGSGGAVYKVDPHSFSCTCPDAHRRGKGCKHSIAVYALGRAFRPSGAPVHQSTARRCGAEPKITRHAAGLVVREPGPSSSYAERACVSCLSGLVYEERAGWVSCAACSGTGRAYVFVYPEGGRLGTCAGCGERFPGRELTEVTEEHESLTWFVGDRLCEPCAPATPRR